MREAGAAGLLARRADVVPDVHRHERHGVIFVEDDVQPVGQRELGVRDVELPTVGEAAPQAPARGAASAGGYQAAEMIEHVAFIRPITNTLRDVFSVACPARSTAEPFGRARWPRRERGRSCIDLTLSNPTRAGIHYPADRCSRRCRQPAALTYRPAAARPARRARGGGGRSTRGAAYSIDAGSHRADGQHQRGLLAALQAPVRSGRANVLTPVPSYPLFDHLTRLDGVEQRRYCARVSRRVDRSTSDERRSRVDRPDARRAARSARTIPTGSVV